MGKIENLKVKVKEIDSYLFHTGYTYIITFVDENNNKYEWNTKKLNAIKENISFIIKSATIKEESNNVIYVKNVKLEDIQQELIKETRKTKENNFKIEPEFLTENLTVKQLTKEIQNLLKDMICNIVIFKKNNKYGYYTNADIDNNETDNYRESFKSIGVDNIKIINGWDTNFQNFTLNQIEKVIKGLL
jgi:c-di-GMP-binding flagellar brake protein YcgR